MPTDRMALSDDRGLLLALQVGHGAPRGLARRPDTPAVRVLVTGYRARRRRRYAATEGGAATAAATPRAVITASRMPSAPLPGTVTTEPVMFVFSAAAPLPPPPDPV